MINMKDGWKQLKKRENLLHLKMYPRLDTCPIPLSKNDPDVSESIKGRGKDEIRHQNGKSMTKEELDELYAQD